MHYFAAFDTGMFCASLIDEQCNHLFKDLSLKLRETFALDASLCSQSILSFENARTIHTSQRQTQEHSQTSGHSTVTLTHHHHHSHHPHLRPHHPSPRSPPNNNPSPMQTFQVPSSSALQSSHPAMLPVMPRHAIAKYPYVCTVPDLAKLSPEHLSP